MNNARYMDSYSITDYSDIIKAIANEKINISDFQSFQLFYDGDLHSLLFNDEKDIDNRIGDNSKLYKQIDDVVRFGDPEHDLAKDFSEDFIKHIIDNHSKQECWSDGITYEEVKKSQRKKEKGADFSQICFFYCVLLFFVLLRGNCGDITIIIMVEEKSMSS